MSKTSNIRFYTNELEILKDEEQDFYTNLGTGFYVNPGPSDSNPGTPECLALQSDGKIIVAGIFDRVNGNTRTSIIRLNSDGTEDTSFYTNLGTGFSGSGVAAIYNLSIQSDNKILVVGSFTSLNGNTRNGLVRLNSDGTEDTSFYTNLGTGFQTDRVTYNVKIQSDNKILISGNFTTFNGNTRNGLVRLNSDGTEDTSFYTNLGTGFNNMVYGLAIQSDGKILLGGAFTTFNGNTRNCLVRLNSDGTEDTSFYTNLGTGFGSAGSLYLLEIKIQSDNKILISGNFTTFNGNTRKYLVRLNSDGTEDTSFYTNLGTGFNSGIAAIMIDNNSKILLGGAFTTFNGNTRNCLTILNLDGTESSFHINIGTGIDSSTSSIEVISIDSNHNLYLGGRFLSYQGNTRRGLIKINGTPYPLVTPIVFTNNGSTELKNTTTFTTANKMYMFSPKFIDSTGTTTTYTYSGASSSLDDRQLTDSSDFGTISGGTVTLQVLSQPSSGKAIKASIADWNAAGYTTSTDLALVEQIIDKVAESLELTTTNNTNIETHWDVVIFPNQGDDNYWLVFIYQGNDPYRYTTKYR